MNDNARPLITAHTGSGQAPANTWSSFLEACDARADVAEVDIRVTKKQEPILMHDHSPLLEQYGVDELNQLPLRAQLGDIYVEHELVKLEELLQEAIRRQIKLNLDIKNGEAVNPTLKLVKAARAEHLIYVTGCTEGIEVEASGMALLLNAPMSMIIKDGTRHDQIDGFCQQAQQEGYAGVNLHEAMVTPAFVDIAHAHNLFVSVYTVNEPQRMKELIEMKVDSITTMKPELLHRMKGGQAR